MIKERCEDTRERKVDREGRHKRTLTSTRNHSRGGRLRAKAKMVGKESRDDARKRVRPMEWQNRTQLVTAESKSRRLGRRKTHLASQRSRAATIVEVY